MRIDAYTKVAQLYQASGFKKMQNTQKAHDKDQNQVTISRVGSEFGMARQAAGDAPEVRESLVASLKQQISDGTYFVSGERFAEKLLDRYNEIERYNEA